MLYDQNFYWTNYHSLTVFICTSLSLTMVLLLVSIFISEQRSHFEKNSAYECGFEQFNNALNIIDNQFYLVAILFLIFDLEITILFPWLMFLSIYGIFEYLTVLVFLLILTVGFIFEWKRGVLNWI